MKSAGAIQKNTEKRASHDVLFSLCENAADKLILLVLLGSVLLFILWPIACIALRSLRGVFGTVLRQYGESLRNSVFVGVFTAVLSTILSLSAALVCATARGWKKTLCMIIMLVAMVSPPFVSSLAYIQLYGRRGWITYRLLHLSLNPYNRWGVILMQSISFVPLNAMFLSGILEKLDEGSLRSARDLGASGGAILRDIVLPLIRPATLVCLLLSFVRSLADFGTPIIIGGRFSTLAADIYLQVVGYWNNYSSTIMKRPLIVRVSRYLSYLDAAACALLVLDRFILKLAYIINAAIHADSNPTDTLSMMAYMAYNQRSLFAIGISYTVRLALFGTAIAFVLALLMVFLRIQEPDKRDNDFVKFLKIVANKFSRFYIFVIRGTPMMVQSLILYNAVFGLFKRTGMSVSDINRVWPLFLAGLVTISLNSTAYLAEVLRGGILAVDAGQMEAARSLGMTHWQAMRKVVFPQAIKNSLPAIGNEFIINIKDSSVLCVVGVSDLMFMTRSVAGIYYKGTECYLIAAIVYLFLTYLSSLLLKAITGKMTAPDNTKRHQGNQTVDLGLPSSN